LAKDPDRDARQSVTLNAAELDLVAKQPKTSAELEDVIRQKLLVASVYASVRRDPIFNWRATVVTAPKHAKSIREHADKIAAELAGFSAQSSLELPNRYLRKDLLTSAHETVRC
jgi:hypothetical protein